MQIRLPWLLSRKRLGFAVIVDTVLFGLVYSGAFQLRFGRWPAPSVAVTGLLLLWVLSSYVLGRYHAFRRQGLALLIDQILRAMAVLLFSLVLYLGYIWITGQRFGLEDRRGFLVPVISVFALLSFLGQILVSRLVRRRTRCAPKWWILGSEQLEQALLRELSWSRIDCQLSQCSFQQLDTARSESDLQGIVVSFSCLNDPMLLKQLLTLQKAGLKVVSVLGWSELVLQRFPPSLIDEIELLRGDFLLPSGSVPLRLKRLGDVFVCALLLLITSPLLLAAAVMIALDDAGPVFYTQIRSGLAGQPFKIWKLRSMRTDAERDGAQWVGRQDSRITRIGRLLRLTRIDELPQLVSVFKGQMSLIGPRPERPELEQELERQIPHYNLRHWVRPGLSGWAQVNYPYGASVEDAANKLSYDLYYSRNFSFWLDLLILVKTIRLFFNAHGAVPVNKRAPRIIRIHRQSNDIKNAALEAANGTQTHSHLI